MNAPLQAVRSAMLRLNPRERLLVTIFCGILLIVAVVKLAVIPVANARANLARRTDILTADLSRMEAIARQITALEKKEASRKRTSRNKGGFSLFAFVEQAAARSVNREAVASMNPSRRPRPDGSEEPIVELQLVATPLSDLVALLRNIEQPSNPAYVKRIEIKRRYEDHSRFDATVIVGALTAS